MEGLTIPKGMKAIGVRTLRQAINAVLSRDRNKDRSEDLAWEPEGALEPG